MEKDILAYFAKLKKKGASQAAIIADKAGLRIIIFLSSYFAFFYLLHNFFLPFVLSGVTTFCLSYVFSYIEKVSIEKYANKQIKEIKKTLCLQKLLLCGKKRRMRFFESFIKTHFKEEISKTKKGFVSKNTYYHIMDHHPSAEITADDMLLLYEQLLHLKKQKCIIIAFSGFSDTAKDFLSLASNFDFELCDKDILFDISSSLISLVSDEEVFDYIRDKIKQSKITLKEIKKEIFASHKFKAYIITGIALGVLAILTRFPAYFISMSALCITLGIFTCTQQRENRL